MKWITAKQLEQWADSNPSAANSLPKIVSDLIRATSNNIRSIRFPSGEKGQIRGFDGYLVSKIEALNIPLGESFWEFGTNRDYIAKANGDFNKRSQEVSSEKQEQSSFVFVSPRAWDSSKKDNKLEDWIKEKKKKYKWKNIYYLDGVQLEAWLEQCPAVAAWHAKNTLQIAPQSGIRSTDEFWEDFSGRFEPPLTEEVLLCGRQKDAKEILRSLLSSNSLKRYLADTEEEVIAFAVAAIRKAKPRTRLLLESRTLVIDSLDAGRYCLASLNPTTFLLRGDAAKSPTQFAQTGSVIVPITPQQKNTEASPLRRPYIHELAKSLQSMGFSHADANKYAYGSGRSLTALARLIPSGATSQPLWLDDANLLLPLILINSWDIKYKLDREIVQKFANRAYNEYDFLLREKLFKSEYPIEFEGDVWKSKTPLDSLIHIGHLITEDHLKKLEEFILQVFSQKEIDTHTLSIQEHIELPSTSYSDWLQEGLAESLLMISVWGKNESLFPNLSNKTSEYFAEKIVKSLFQQPDSSIIEHRLLSYFSEATPKIFLNSIESLLSKNAALIETIFVETNNHGIPSSKHTYLLFALEELAWIPEYFEQTAIILTKLAHIDPGGRLGNRPIKSLQEIFCLWVPNTHATLEQKEYALEKIIDMHPNIGWNILVSLLPDYPNRTVMVKPKPRFRDMGAFTGLTYQQLWDTEDKMVLKAILLAGISIEKWETLISRMPAFSEDIFHNIVLALDKIFPQLAEQDCEFLWTKLKDKASFYQKLISKGEEKYTLKQEQIDTLDSLLSKHHPKNPLFFATYIFSQPGHLYHYDQESNQKIKDELLQEIIKDHGVIGLFELAQKTKNSYELLLALQRVDLSTDFLKEIIIKAIQKDDSLINLATSCYAIYIQRVEAAEAEHWTKEQAVFNGWKNETLTSLLHLWPEQTSTWHMVKRFDQDTYTQYWITKRAFMYKGHKLPFYRLILMNLRFDHAYNAMVNAWKRYNDLPTKLIFRILSCLVTEINKNPEKLNNDVVYHLEEILSELDQREDVNKHTLLQCEFALLPLLFNMKRELYIHTAMSINPELYHSIFMGTWGERKNITNDQDLEKDNNLRSLYYQLLDKFHIIPGRQGESYIDSAFLRDWIDKVRSLCQDADLVDLQDSKIGELLAHVSNDPEDEAWPHQAVRDQIDRLKNIHIENGIATERFNMRGVHGVDRENPGKQEKQFASTYSEYAKVTLSKWPQTSALLKNIAEGWMSHAEREVIRARQDKMRR